jgi:hypothetical protein
MRANLQAANRLANAISDKQQLSSAEPVNVAEQYDALPILRKWKPVDANECAEEVQLRNYSLTPAFKLAGLSKHAATISLSQVRYDVKQKLWQPDLKWGS